MIVSVQSKRKSSSRTAGPLLYTTVVGVLVQNMIRTDCWILHIYGKDKKNSITLRDVRAKKCKYKAGLKFYI